MATFGTHDSLGRLQMRGETLPEGFAVGIAKLAQLVVWAYSGRHDNRDRLQALQNVLARTLRGSEPRAAYAQIVRDAAEVERHLQWFWATYWGGKLVRYLAHINQATELVDTTKAQYEAELAELNKRLTDSTLAAVAVVLGSFVAAVFKDFFHATVFTIGVLLYAAHLLIFPACVGMTQVHQRFLSVREDFQNRRELLRTLLYDNPVDSLLASVPRTEVRFYRWFFRIRWIYALLFLGLIGGAFLVPRLMQ